jgi:RNA polymerase sigma-70 factor, ECF subfamily
MPNDLDVSASSDLGLQQLMCRYQQADRTAVPILIEELSPQLYRFLASQTGSRADADDMLQDLWLRIHRARHSYRPGEPVLPWVYAIARRVRTDNYRQRHRMAAHETTVDVLPEFQNNRTASSALAFGDLVGLLSERQRTVVTMLKVNGMTIEEVAHATASTIGAVKQDAYRAYERLRRLLGRTPPEQPVRSG